MEDSQKGEELIVLRGKEEQDSKPKVIISKKVAARAVDRNRIRRIIKEALRGTSGKITVIVKKNIANLKMQEIKTKIK